MRLWRLGQGRRRRCGAGIVASSAYAAAAVDAIVAVAVAVAATDAAARRAIPGRGWSTDATVWKRERKRERGNRVKDCDRAGYQLFIVCGERSSK